MATVKHEIRNHFTREVKFVAEIDCADDATDAVKTGLAVTWALANGANLTGADLTGAKGVPETHAAPSEPPSPAL
jgi:hypothetical protein